MKNPCEVIRDLLPLSVDGVASKPSEEMVKEHLEECEECKKIHENMIVKLDEPEIDINYKMEIKPFKKVLRYIKIVFIAILCYSVILGGIVGYYVYIESDLYLRIHNYKIECNVNEEIANCSSANQYMKEVLNVIMKEMNLSDDTLIRLRFDIDKRNHLSYFEAEFQKGNKAYRAENIDYFPEIFEINRIDIDDLTMEPELTIKEYMDMLDALQICDLRRVEGSTLEVSDCIYVAKTFKKIGVNTQYVKIKENADDVDTQALEDTLLFEEYDADVKRGFLIVERSIIDDEYKNIYVYKIE